ncbi:MAG: hypothetical protein AAB490_03500 [Patescibacteria group bacterium]
MKNRDRMLRRKIAALQRKLSRWIDETLDPGEQFLIIASFDIYEPMSEGQMNEISAYGGSRQKALDETHGELLKELNDWAKKEGLLQGEESVCVDIGIRRRIPSPSPKVH